MAWASTKALSALAAPAAVCAAAIALIAKTDRRETSDHAAISPIKDATRICEAVWLAQDFSQLVLSAIAPGLSGAGDHS